MQSLGSPSKMKLQAKANGHRLQIGHARDAAEQEADVVAEQVMRTPLSGAMPMGIGMHLREHLQRKCAACGQEEQVQRKPLIQMRAGTGTLGGITASPQVQQGIAATRGGGHAIDGRIRSQMEGRFGQSFAGVRIHTGSYAQALSSQVQARAFTVGKDIYFNRGEYEPGTVDGQKLLAHELVHTVQQTGQIQRQPRRPTPMTRTQFEQTMRSTFGVTTIRDATHDEQVQINRIPNTPPATLPHWRTWGPGASSRTYDNILAGFQEFARIWGGLPVVSEINFMRVKYVASGGTIWEDTNEAASFGLYDLNIYQGFERRASPLPVGRSTAPSQAALDTPTTGASQVRSTIHELSHGIGVAAAQPLYAGNTTPPSSRIFTEWNNAVGWYHGMLYDIGVPAVATAIQTNTAPPPQYRITIGTWNDGNWVEQPVSAYATTKPAEDFAESVMTYGVNPTLLQSRSPARYNFIHTRRALLQTRLRTPTPASATPTPATPTPAGP